MWLRREHNCYLRVTAVSCIKNTFDVLCLVISLVYVSWFISVFFVVSK